MRWRLLAQRLLIERASQRHASHERVVQLLASNNSQDSQHAIAQAHGLAVLKHFNAGDAGSDTLSTLAASALKSTNASLV